MFAVLMYFCRNLKARANIHVYSNTLFSGKSFEDEKTLPYGDDTRNCMVCDTKSDRPPCFVLRKGPSMPRRNWSIRREEPSIAIAADLRPCVTHTGLAVSTALFVLVIFMITHSSSMKGPRLNFHADRELAHPKTTYFSSFLQLQYPHVRRRRVVCRYSKKQVTPRQCWGTGIAHSCRGNRGEMICKPRSARYVVRYQAEMAEDAERTGEHQRTQQHAIVRFFPDFVVFDGFI